MVSVVIFCHDKREADFFCKLCGQCVAVINNERLQCCILSDEDYEKVDIVCILFYAGDRCIYVPLWKNSKKRNTAHHMEILVYRSSLPVSPDCHGKNTAYRFRAFCRTLADLSYHEQSG